MATLNGVPDAACSALQILSAGKDILLKACRRNPAACKESLRNKIRQDQERQHGFEEPQVRFQGKSQRQMHKKLPETK